MELKLVLVSAISILGRDDLEQVARILIVIICILNTVELKRSSQVKFNQLWNRHEISYNNLPDVRSKQLECLFESAGHTVLELELLVEKHFEVEYYLEYPQLFQYLPEPSSGSANFEMGPFLYLERTLELAKPTESTDSG